MELIMLGTGNAMVTRCYNTCFVLSSGEEYFPDFCEMCQVRFWKVTRTVNQIKKSMYTEVDYTDKNLLLYLPMNELQYYTM